MANIRGNSSRQVSAGAVGQAGIAESSISVLWAGRTIGLGVHHEAVVWFVGLLPGIQDREGLCRLKVPDCKRPDSSSGFCSGSTACITCKPNFVAN